tara:strand:+ start:2013 stop:2942 length:930 start_codon:yes stop_codon:yes gene_type:complete
MKSLPFFAKILLFGEYGIILDSKGLSIPCFFFKGVLKISKTNNDIISSSHLKLREFGQFLKKVPKTLVGFDWSKINEDFSNNLYFDSNIPQGYGLGSSGAIVAAFYDRYALNKINLQENLSSDKIALLKNIFAKMESFFHGTSSGLDPLNSYLGAPILIHSKDQIVYTPIPAENMNGKGAVFLLDTCKSRETEHMVSLFFENMKNESFSNMMQNEFKTVTASCIDDFIAGNVKSLFQNVKRLSLILFKHFSPMIPSDFHNIWNKGIQTNTYYLKLCGSGGGGFILGFTEDLKATKKTLVGHSLEVVYHF